MKVEALNVLVCPACKSSLTLATNGFTDMDIFDEPSRMRGVKA
jgi:uncharacterized protein YbaR (Trm112 family)